MLSIDGSTSTTINSDLLCTSLNCITLKVLVNRFACWSIMYEITNYIKQSGIYVSVEVFKTTCHTTGSIKINVHTDSQTHHTTHWCEISVYTERRWSVFLLYFYLITKNCVCKIRSLNLRPSRQNLWNSLENFPTRSRFLGR